MDESANQNEQLTTELLQPNKQLMTLSEIARLLNVPKSWIYQRTQHGPGASIPFVKLGKYLRFDPDEVLAFFKSQGSGYFR